MKNSIPKLVSLAICLLILNACSNGPLCRVKNGNEGIITGNFPISPSCFRSREDQYLIKTDSAYQAMFELQLHDFCKNEKLPAIDFSRHSVLGLEADAGCEAGFVRRAERDDINRKIIYTVEAYSCGNCKSLIISDNIVTIPAVPEDYTAEFKVVEK